MKLACLLLMLITPIRAHWLDSAQWHTGLPAGSYKLVCDRDHEVIGEVVHYSYVEQWEAHYLTFTQKRETVMHAQTFDNLADAKRKVESGAIETGVCSQ